MKKYFLEITAAVVLILLFSGAGLYYYNITKTYEASVSLFEIEKGESLRKISENLKRFQLIKNEMLFLTAAKITNAAEKMKYGTYQIPDKISVLSLIQLLQTGQRQLKTVTIPPGYTSMQIAELIDDELKIPKEEFLKKMKDPQLISFLGYDCVKNLEGFLYPDTYKFPAAGANLNEIIKMMLANFKKAVSKYDLSKLDDLNLTVCDAVNLASIVNYEVRHWEEGWKIASVYYNRLKKGWLLQADPTIQYILGKRKERLLYKDLEVDSPYNTYKYKGLPPTPIGNADIRAFEAVLKADTDFNYMYFVANTDGYHIFSKTNNQHINAKNRIKRKKRGY